MLSNLLLLEQVLLQQQGLTPRLLQMLQQLLNALRAYFRSLP
jgi:hypothetical protein